MKISEICEDCKWWEFIRETLIKDKPLKMGYCHRYPPPNFPITQPKPDVDDFPYVADRYWCGEFTLNPKCAKYYKETGK